jgi:hypothetical protein
LNRIVRVVDGVRDLAVWLSPAYATHGAGRGPLAASGLDSMAAQTKPAASNPAYSKVHSGGVSVTDVTVLGDIPD